MKHTGAGCDTVDAREFILAHESSDERALKEATVTLDGYVQTKSDGIVNNLRIDRSNIECYCEVIADRIVYKFTQQVEDEQFWKLIFNELLAYAFRKHFPESSCSAA